LALGFLGVLTFFGFLTFAVGAEGGGRDRERHGSSSFPGTPFGRRWRADEDENDDEGGNG